MTKSHLRIELGAIHCSDTEDVWGEDELYFTGAVLQDAVPPKAILTKVIGINDDQAKYLSLDQRLLFDGDVDDGLSIALYLEARDEDVGHDWANRPSWVDKMSEALAAKLGAAAGVALVSNPAGWATVGAAVASAAALAGFYWLMGSDKDDLLGKLERIVPAKGPASESVAWRFSRNDWTGYSSWAYEVRLVVARQSLPPTYIKPIPRPKPPSPRPPKPKPGQVIP
jgi:hypothetical protein